MPALTQVQLLPLPDYARVDLAHFEIVKIANPGAVQRVLYTIPGDIICIVEAVSFQLTTSGLAGNRGMLLSLRDQDGTDTMRVATPFDHPAATTRQYNFLSTCSTVQGPFGFDYMLPVPPAIAFAGFQISLFITVFQPADAISNIRLSCIHIPTGPERATFALPTPIVFA